MMTQAIVGCLLGTAVGDALGLPYEGLSARRAARFFKARDRYHLLWNRGMVSDDTEHTCMVAQSLIEAREDVAIFAKQLARRLRWWMAGLPAGVGFATLRAILKLWCGVSPQKSGVFSAGNGPAMRSALLGVYYGHNEEKLREFVRAATILTHTDPKAYWGALTVAMAAHLGCSSAKVDGDLFYNRITSVLAAEPASEFLELIRAAVHSVKNRQTTREFAISQGLEQGVTGYVYHTVPAVIHAWLSSPDDFEMALLSVIECGGDTDTTGAILGGIVGSRVGKQGIPKLWLDHLWEWPRSLAWMERLGRQLAETTETKALELPPYEIVLRNLFFLVVILVHGFRRLLPPF